MNMQAMRAWLLAGAVACLLVLVGAQAQAGTAGRATVAVKKIHQQYFTIAAGTATVIETVNLSAGADTVLHVQEVAVPGRFVDGNDDCGTRVAGCVGLRSYVSIPYVNGVTRGVYIIVRAKSASSAGTAWLRITNAGNTVDYPISFGAGYQKAFSSIRDEAHFETVEQQGGCNDTMLLVTSQYSWRAVAFDRYMGTDLMASVHMPEACTSGCSVIVGSVDFIHELPTTLVWDEDVHYVDSDQDGLSDTLENSASVGSSPVNDDTDGDGIDDGAEVLAVDTAPGTLKLPYYGAHPLTRDLFVQADWIECVQPNPGSTLCGPDPRYPDRDYYRLTDSDAVDVWAKFGPSHANVHIDTGRQSATPNTVHGAWGGASRKTSYDPGNACQWLSTERVGYFHFGRINTAGSTSGTGACFNAQAHNAPVFAHELGHNLNLSHGGNTTAPLDVNCKPNYISIMSYAVLGIPGASFSWNQLTDHPLTPTAMSEATGLGSGNTAHLTSASGGFQYALVDGNGGVDWNRNGEIELGIVRAAATWGPAGGGCAHTDFRRDAAVDGRSYSALVRLPSTGSETRTYWFTRRPDGKLEYRYATRLPNQCIPAGSCNANWTPSVSLDGTLLTSETVVTAPAAAKYLNTGTGWTWGILLVFRPTAFEPLKYKKFDGYSWSATASVPGSLSSDGEPAAVTTSDGVTHVYAKQGTVLKEWTFTGPSSWSAPVTQSWVGSGSIEPNRGIGATVGYLSIFGQQIVAAIPLSNPWGQVEVAWKSPSSSMWYRLAATAWAHGQPFTTQRPAIAYVPFDPNGSLSDGRFYLAWNPAAGGAFLMTESEGNQVTLLAPPPNRKLKFLESPVMFYNEWATGQENPSLLYDLALDKSLLGAFTGAASPGSSRPVFSPYADGIFPGTIVDQDDYAVIEHNLSCSLHNTATCL